MLFLPENENLVTYYILPLAGINKKLFGRKFKTSLINKQGTKIFVELTSSMKSEGYSKVKTYKTDLLINKKVYAIYEVPSMFSEDLELFLQGKYSEMSSKCKTIIYNGSTLPYNKTKGDFRVSSPILQALDKTKTLRKFLLDSIGITDLPINAELMTKPLDWWFIENAK